mmetsp:Transcript_3866/g.6063  ORF Transcript_3866/g.6063 Transcript_3866/m.6063 type:complete len:205 (-) Transcript_3866:1118-1732(-)
MHLHLLPSSCVRLLARMLLLVVVVFLTTRLDALQQSRRPLLHHRLHERIAFHLRLLRLPFLLAVVRHHRGGGIEVRVQSTDAVCVLHGGGAPRVCLEGHAIAAIGAHHVQREGHHSLRMELADREAQLGDRILHKCGVEQVLPAVLVASRLAFVHGGAVHHLSFVSCRICLRARAPEAVHLHALWLHFHHAEEALSDTHVLARP